MLSSLSCKVLQLLEVCQTCSIGPSFQKKGQQGTSRHVGAIVFTYYHVSLAMIDILVHVAGTLHALLYAELLCNYA